MPIDGPTRAPAGRGAGRRRTREQRRNRRSAAFDLLAVLAAVALVGLGLANLYLVGEADLAARQGLIAAGGVLALAVFWRVRVRFLGVLAWAAYGAAVVLLVGVLAVGLSANGATRWIAIGSLTFQPSELAKLGLLLVLAAVLGSGRPPWQRFVARPAAGGRAHRAHPAAAGPQHRDAARRPHRGHAGARAGARAVPAAAGRRGGDLRAAADQPPAALPGGPPRQLPGRRPRVADRLGLGRAAGEHRGGLRRAVRADRRPAPPPARAVPARTGHRPGAGQPGRPVGPGRRRRGGARRDRPGVAARAGQPGVAHAARRARRRRAGDPAGDRDRGLGGRQPRAAAPGRRPVPARQLRRHGARRAPGRHRGRPRRPPGRRPQAAVGAAGPAQPAAAAGPAGRGRALGRCSSRSGVYGWRLQITAGRGPPGRRGRADDPLLPAARPPRLDHRPARRAAGHGRRGRRHRRGPGARRARPAARPARRRGPARRAHRPAARGPARPDRRGRGHRCCRCRWPTCRAASATR